MPPTNTLTLPELDRQAERRKDPDWLRAALIDPATRILPVCGTRNLVRGDDPEACVLPSGCLAELEGNGSAVVFLGTLDGVAHFAVEVPTDREEVIARAADAATWAELRGVAPRLDAASAALLAYARSMIWWHQRHRFCGVCGSPTVPEEGGHVRRCTNVRCATPHFPRTDPAVIALVTHGDAALLANQPQWARETYSTLAGFVEPGESLEEATRRELWEEAGVRLREVRYHSSQPWPFPQSLMVAFEAEAESRELRLDPTELRDARWFTRAELRAAVAEGSVKLPYALSIARKLIDGWLDSAEARGT